MPPGIRICKANIAKNDLAYIVTSAAQNHSFIFMLTCLKSFVS